LRLIVFCLPEFLSQPLGGFSRTASRRPGFPRTHPRRRSPRNFAALFHAATPMGFALQSFPLPESRTALRRPSCFLAGSTSTMSGATDRVCRDRFPPSAADRAVRQTREGPRRDRGDGNRVSCESRDRQSQNSSYPVKCPWRPTRFVGLAGVLPDRPLRSFAPSENPFTRRSRRSPSLRP
jgi:hypothetical protein